MMKLSELSWMTGKPSHVQDTRLLELRYKWCKRKFSRPPGWARCVKFFSWRTRLDFRKFYVTPVWKDVNESLLNWHGEERIRISRKSDKRWKFSRVAVEILTIFPVLQKILHLIRNESKTTIITRPDRSTLAIFLRCLRRYCFSTTETRYMNWWPSSA